MSAFTDIILRTSASSCVECGKCSAACSMAAMYGDFSLDETPRGIVQYALQHAGAHAETCPGSIWRCLQCGNCSMACPENVDCAKLIAMLRDEARKTGIPAPARSCSCCGREIMAAPVTAWLRETLGEESRDEAPLPSFLEKYAGDAPGNARPAGPRYEELCPVCRRRRYAANNTAGEGR